MDKKYYPKVTMSTDSGKGWLHYFEKEPGFDNYHGESIEVPTYIIDTLLDTFKDSYEEKEELREKYEKKIIRLRREVNISWNRPCILIGDMPELMGILMVEYDVPEEHMFSLSISQSIDGQGGELVLNIRDEDKEEFKKMNDKRIGISKEGSFHVLVGKFCSKCCWTEQKYIQLNNEEICPVCNAPFLDFQQKNI